MAIKKSSSTGIPFGDNAGRPANPGYGQLYSNGEAARLELYTQESGWQNIVQETPGVASITGVYSQQSDSGTITISGTNFVTGAIASVIGTDGIEIQADTTTFNSLVQITASFTGLSEAYEPYDVKVTNPSNLFGMLPDVLYVNNTPVWTTSSGSVGSVYSNGTASISLVASDEESSSLTYSITSGSLPTGLSLNSSTGVISGTATGINNTTVYTFTVRASDGVNYSARSFSITIVGILDISDITSSGLLTQASAENLTVGSSYSTLTPLAGSIGGTYVGRTAGGSAPTYDGSSQSVSVVSWGTGKAFDQRGIKGWRSTADIPITGLQPSTMILIGEVNNTNGNTNGSGYHIGINFGKNGTQKTRAIASSGTYAKNVWYSNDTNMTITAAVGSKDIYVLRNVADTRNFKWNTKTQSETGTIADINGVQHYTDGPTPLWTQWRDETGSYPYGYVAEWFVFDRYLTDAEVARIIAYGKAKYGIS